MTDRDHEWLAERFAANRAHLLAVAYRMLGSPTEAEDALQEAWLRLGRADVSGVDNPEGWLTTIVARVCLDMLRSRKARSEEALESHGVAEARETLTPAERVAFVLHDMFDLPFNEIAPIIERSPAATRQLASRARRRVQGATHSGNADRNRQREVVAAFLAASREGDFSALLSVLDPEVVLLADGATVQVGAEPEVRGAHAVARFFAGRARAARPALINGAAGLVWAPGERPRVVFDIKIERDKILAIELIADPQRIAALHLVMDT